MRKMVINKDKLNKLAEPLSQDARSRMDERRINRHWWSASSAIAAKIRRQLKRLGMTQTEFADLLGITPANVTRYLKGRTNFELRTLIEIERAIGINIINRTVVPEDELLPLEDIEVAKRCAGKENVSLNITYNMNILNQDCIGVSFPKWEEVNHSESFEIV